MSTTRGEAYGYTIANTCLEGILIPPLVIIWGLSFCVVRSRQDPARLPFTWMKITYPLIILAFFFHCGGYIANILQIGPIYNGDIFDGYGLDNYFWTLDQIETRLFDVSFLFENLGNTFLLYCLVDLGLSFLYVSDLRPKGSNIIRAMTAGLGVLLFALTLGYLGKIEALRTDFYNALSNSYYSSGEEFFTEPYSLVQLAAAFDIILWIASIAVAAFTIYVFIVSRETTRIRSSAILYLVIGILNLFRNTWVLAYDATWYLPKTFHITPLYVTILWPIFDAWVTFIVLVLIFVIGCRRGGGLWTTAQPSTGIFGAVRQPQPVQQHWQSPQQAVPQGGGVQYYQQAPDQQELK